MIQLFLFHSTVSDGDVLLSDLQHATSSSSIGLSSSDLRGIQLGGQGGGDATVRVILNESGEEIMQVHSDEHNIPDPVAVVNMAEDNLLGSSSKTVDSHPGASDSSSEANQAVRMLLPSLSQDYSASGLVTTQSEHTASSTEEILSKLQKSLDSTAARQILSSSGHLLQDGTYNQPHILSSLENMNFYA